MASRQGSPNQSRAGSPTQQNPNVVGQQQAPPVAPPAAVAAVPTLAQLLAMYDNRFNLLDQEMAQAQQTIQAQNLLIQQLQTNAVPVVPAVPVQKLPGLTEGTVLRNGKGDVISVDESLYIVKTVGAQVMSPEARNAIATPVLLMKDVLQMEAADYLKFAAALCHYYTVGGEKPITAFIGADMIEGLAMRFGLTVSDFGNLTRQLQIYEFLKAWWVKPEDNASITIEAIKKIELLPAKKGNVQMVVGIFIAAMKKVVTHEFTKPLLDAIRNQVFIKNWIDDFKTKSYSSFNDFYKHLMDLAKEYDDSNQQVKNLESSKPRPDRNEKAKNGNGAAKSPTVKEENKTQEKKEIIPKCKMCGQKGHWTFDSKTDYSKPFGDHIVWSCPDIANPIHTIEIKKKIYSDRQEVVKKKKAKLEAGGASKKA